MCRNLIGVRWISAAALAAGLALGGATATQAEEGAWYIGANMPLMFIDDTDSTATTTFGQGQMSVTQRSMVRSEHDTGYKLGGVLGYHLDRGIRIEGELFLARAEVSKLTHTSISLPGLQQLQQALPTKVDVPVSGSANQLGAMVNLWYDIDTGSDWTPYVGAGLGFIRIDQGGVRYNTNAVKDAVGQSVQAAVQQNPALGAALGPLQGLQNLDVPELSATDSAFAYQFGAGIGYALSDSTTLHIGYRLQALNGLEFAGTGPGVSTRSETDLRVHFLEIGIRYRF